MKKLLLFALLCLSQFSFSQLRYSEGLLGNKFYSSDKIVTKKEFESVLRKNDTAYDMYRDGKGWKTASIIWSLSSGTFLALGLQTKNETIFNYYGTYTINNSKKRNAYYYMAGGSFIMALICDSVGTKYKKAGVRAANEGMGFSISL